MLIKANGLCFEYTSNDEQGTTVPVLHDINIEVNDGEFVAVLGHNGSGKSTLAKHINAILYPTSGTIIVDGIDTSNEEMTFEIRRRVGMVFQNPDNQIVATIVEEDVAFALENLGIEPQKIRTRVDDALKTVDMYDYKDHAPHNLSGGQKQRVAIAGVIAMRPKCIVLDEPTAMLDPRGRREVIDTIKQLNRDFNTTVIYITHFMDEAVQANRVVVIDNGKIVYDAPPDKVFTNVKELKEIGLDVPQVTELAHYLNEHDILISNDILTVDDCINELEKLLKDC